LQNGEKSNFSNLFEMDALTFQLVFTMTSELCLSGQDSLCKRHFQVIRMAQTPVYDLRVPFTEHF
jgi:hypothetical protein